MMGSDWRLKDFRRVFEHFGVRFSYTKHGHLKLEREVAGERLVYPVPTIKGRYVKALYVGKARKAMRLAARDGISKSEFNRAL